MSLLLVGECLGVETRERSHDGNTWLDKTVGILRGIDVEKATLGRDFNADDVPAEGEFIVMEVAPRAYSGRNGAGFALTAIRRVRALEDVMRPHPGEQKKAS